jgi:hypothetical protein
MEFNMFGLKTLQCRGVKKAGWHYLDDTLSASRRAKIEKHLTACLNCRTEYTRRMGVLEALKQGMPIDAALVQETSPKKRFFRLALTGLMILLAVAAGAGWYSLSSSDFGFRISDLKSRIAALFPAPAEVQEKKPLRRMSSQNPEKPLIQPSALALFPHESSIAPTASIRLVKPKARSVTKPVNSEPRFQVSGFGVQDSGQQVGDGTNRSTIRIPHSAIRDRNNPKSKQSETRTPKPETRNLNNSRIQVYDESGRLIKSEQVKAGGRK